MIAVTGLGAITALGNDVEQTWARILRGDRAFGEISLFSAEGYRVGVVAEAKIDVAPSGDVSRTSELARRAASEALAQAGMVGQESTRPRRVGLVVGGSTAGLLETESTLAVLLDAAGDVDGAVRGEALERMINHPLSAPTDRLARELGPFTRVRSLSSACSSGVNAILVGATWLELGLVDAVLCGASDALCRVTLSGFNALGALDPEGARPFDRRRRGLTLGEGAGFVVLERGASAAARGKDAICTLLGWAARAEAHHITNPEPAGNAPASAMRAALERAGLGPDGIDYVNAHGTGTPLNDPMEARALAQVFGSELTRIPVSSQKGQIGHTLAAGGSVEAIFAAMAVSTGVVPPTGGLEEPDPECPVRHVLRAETRPLRAALSSSFAFGGMDSVLVLGRADAAASREICKARSVVVTGVSVLTPGGVYAGEDVASVPDRPSEHDAIAWDLSAELDMTRARRLDRTSRLAAIACQRALGDGAKDAGVVFANAYGAVEGTAAYMRRLREKGARLASPADFPSLVPSSPAGYVSIYLGLEGPTFAVADLGASGECAVTQAYELLAAGEADRAVAVAVEEKSLIIDDVFRELFASKQISAPRREGGAAVALAAEDAAVTRGLPILARVVEIVSWWANETASAPEIAAPSDVAASVVVIGTPSAAIDALLDRAGWAGCRRVACAERAGSHEASGAVAVAVAAAMLAKDRSLESVLCAGVARGSSYAIALGRWTARAP